MEEKAPQRTHKAPINNAVFPLLLFPSSSSSTFFSPGTAATSSSDDDDAAADDPAPSTVFSIPAAPFSVAAVDSKLGWLSPGLAPWPASAVASRRCACDGSVMMVVKSALLHQCGIGDYGAMSTQRETNERTRNSV